MWQFDGYCDTQDISSSRPEVALHRLQSLWASILITFLCACDHPCLDILSVQDSYRLSFNEAEKIAISASNSLLLTRREEQIMDHLIYIYIYIYLCTIVLTNSMHLFPAKSQIFPPHCYHHTSTIHHVDEHHVITHQPSTIWMSIMSSHINHPLCGWASCHHTSTSHHVDEHHVLHHSC